MAIQKNANLDISVAAEQNPNYNVKPSVQFSTQDRNTAKYTFTVKQNNKAVDLTDVTTTVTLYMADKSVFQNNATVTNAKEGKIEYTIPSDAIRHHGSAKGELKLTYANGDALGGLRFSFNIEQSLIDKVDGSQKEVYIEDFQTISNTVKKKAEEVTIKLDKLDEEYQNKAYTVDEKLADVQETVNDLRENGTGIDAQARQEVEQVSALLAGTPKKGIDAPVNVKDFGAKGDGVTDDTQAIQNALNASNNVIVPISSSFYKTTKTLKMQPYSKITLIGRPTRFNTGIDKVARIRVAANVPVIEVDDGCSIAGGRIEVLDSGYTSGAILIDYSTGNRKDITIDTSIKGFGEVSSIGVLLYGNGDGGACEQVKILGMITDFGIGIKADKISGTCWATRMIVDATINTCYQSIVCLNGAGGEGGYFAGSYQPRFNGTPGTSKPLVEFHNISSLYFVAKIWDMSKAINNYAIALHKCSNWYLPPTISPNLVLINSVRSINVSNPIIPPRGKNTYFDSMSGNEENILFGAHKKYSVAIEKSAYVSMPTNTSYDADGMFKLQQLPTYLILRTDSPNNEEWVSVTITFDVSKTITIFGFSPKSEPIPRPKAYRLYTKTTTDTDFVLRKEKNVADEIHSSGGVPETALYAVLDPGSTARNIISLKYEFLLEKDKFATIDSIWAKGSGMAESYLPLYGGKVYGPVDMNKNPITSRVLENGATSQRPSSPVVAQEFYDRTLGKPIYWNGSKWTDATGAAV